MSIRLDTVDTLENKARLNQKSKVWQSLSLALPVSEITWPTRMDHTVLTET